MKNLINCIRRMKREQPEAVIIVRLNGRFRLIGVVERCAYSPAWSCPDEWMPRVIKNLVEKHKRRVVVIEKQVTR